MAKPTCIACKGAGGGITEKEVQKMIDDNKLSYMTYDEFKDNVEVGQYNYVWPKIDMIMLVKYKQYSNTGFSTIGVLQLKPSVPLSIISGNAGVIATSEYREYSAYHDPGFCGNSQIVFSYNKTNDTWTFRIITDVYHHYQGSSIKNYAYVQRSLISEEKVGSSYIKYDNDTLTVNNGCMIISFWKCNA